MAQLPPLQDPQPHPVPLTRWVLPLLPFEMAEKRERARAVALLPQTAQAMGASAWLIGLSFSNLAWHFVHRYSYNGMIIAPNSVRFG